MRAKLLVLLAVSALLLMACDVSGLVSQFLPQKELEQAQETLQAVVTSVPGMITNVAPTLQAAQTQVAPTLRAVQTALPPLPGGNTPFPTVPGVSKSTSSSSTGNPFTDALSKAKTAAKFRVEVAWIFGGMDKGKYAEQPFINFTGEVDNGKSHMSSTGGLLAMLAADAKTPIEIIEADGKTYMKGVGMFGLADPKTWYLSDNNTTSGFADMAKVDEYKDWIGGSNPGDIKKVRTESLDGQSCDVYVYDMKAVKNAGLGALLGMAQNQNDFGVVDKAETDFWLCGDGFVHKFLLDYEGHNQKDATQKAAMKLTWHAWDFNNATIAVTPPKDAKPLPGSK